MSTVFTRIRFVAVLFVVAAAVAPAQQAPLRDLPKPTNIIEDPFSLVNSTAEFRTGQLLVADGSDGEVTLVDFLKGTRTVLGRKGAGPGEYTNPVAVLRLAGDTIVVFDAAGSQTTMRIVKFLPDLKAGTTTLITVFNTQDTSVVQGTIFPDASGNVYSTSIKLKIGPTGPVPSDTMKIVRFPLTHDAKFITIDAIRFPQAGQREQVPGPSGVKVKIPYFGVATADAWTVFPDGRVAVIRGAGYTIEFISRDGKKTPPVAIPYEHIKLTEADKPIELAAFRKVMSDAMGMIRKTLPAGFTLDIEITPPASWPAEYPPIGLLVAYPAPNGNVWVRRSVPSRLDREQWDVISQAGKVVARWQLPHKTTLSSVGADAVYTVRTDEDDLRYIQRIVLPR